MDRRQDHEHDHEHENEYEGEYGRRPLPRDPSIDAFRGLAIVLMVFFTLTLKLSANLPDALKHNVAGAFHAGDVVLPLFLFTSGVSLSFYLEKRRAQSQRETASDVLGRFGRLTLVGVSLSYFSAMGFGKMDEVLLSALLFLACIALSRIDWRGQLGIILGITSSYIVIDRLGWTDSFTAHYLGGYSAAVYYLPVMLIGMMLGSMLIDTDHGTARTRIWSESADHSGRPYGSPRQILAWVLFVTLILFLVSLLFTPIDKSRATPSFMMLSTLIALLTFIAFRWVVRRTGTAWARTLIFLGRTPLRYWLLMYIGVLIPMMLVVTITGSSFPLAVHWPLAIVTSVGVMVALGVASYIITRLRGRRARKPGVEASAQHAHRQREHH